VGVSRLSVGDAMGYARQRGFDPTYRGNEYKTNLLRKVALEIAVNDDFVERTIECLEQVARTSKEGNIVKPNVPQKCLAPANLFCPALQQIWNLTNYKREKFVFFSIHCSLVSDALQNSAASTPSAASRQRCMQKNRPTAILNRPADAGFRGLTHRHLDFPPPPLSFS
jgi:hypothetical protein